MNILPRRALVSLTGVVAATLLLSACGGGAEPDSAGTEDGETKNLTVLRTNGGQFEGILLGQEEGIWNEHDLQINDEIGADSSAQRVPPLLNGEAQFAQIDATAMIRAAAEGLPVKIVGAVQIAPDQESDGFEPADGLVVPEGSEITELADLEGKTVGVPALGATIHVIALRELEKAGVDPDSVEFIALPAANMISSAEDGQVDAVTLWGTFYGQAMGEGFSAIGPSAGESIESIPQIVWAASEQYIAENPETVEEFMAANAEAQDYANEHPDDRRRLMSEVTELPQDYIDNVWLVPFSNTIRPGAVEEMATSLEQYGFLDEAPAVEDILWEGAATE